MGKCKNCDHNYKGIHCCILKSMEEYQYVNCESFIKKIKRKSNIVKIEQEQKKLLTKNKLLDDGYIELPFKKFILNGGHYSCRKRSHTINGIPKGHK